MPPFILALLSQGLSLIGNTALAKGKEWVEEKTGVKLQPDMPPEDLVKLKQYELEHEEELVKLQVQEDQIGLEMQKLAAANASDVNKTMQVEATSDHWPTYSWRPFIGATFGVSFLFVTVLCCLLAWKAIIGGKPESMAMIPQLIGAFAALFAVPMPILGIASWFRGKMQADPAVQTDNRG